jgi:hypothetical protein
VKEPSHDHQATEEALERVRRTLLVLTRCNEAILRATSEQALFVDVCREIIEAGGYRMCWVGVAEHDERRTVRPVAHAGHEDGTSGTSTSSGPTFQSDGGRPEPRSGKGAWSSGATLPRTPPSRHGGRRR